MAGFFDFIKKGSVSGNSVPSTPTSATSAVVQQEEQVVQTGGSYNGIGNPPQGQAYNGIGPTPGGGAPYNGIGAPPAPPVSTTQTTVVPTPQPAVPQPPPATTSVPVESNAVPKAEEAVNNVAAKTDTKSDTVQAEKQKPEEKQGVANVATGTSALQSTIDGKKREELDLMTHLTQRSNRVFLSAQNKAKELGNDMLDSEHVLHGLLSDSEIYKMFNEMKIYPQVIEEELAKVYKKGSAPSPAPVPGNDKQTQSDPAQKDAAQQNSAKDEKPTNTAKTVQLSPRVKLILANSLTIARKLGFEFVSPEHILIALFEEGEGVGAQTLAKLGLKKEDLNKKVTGKKEGVLESKDKVEDRGKSMIGQFTVDLTAKAAQGLLDPVVERSEVIERVIHILSRRTKNNPALVGEAGVGKTAIVEGLAQKIVSKQVPDPLLDKKILQLDLMSVLAGASHRGEFEERMKSLIEEVQASKGQIILFIDEIHNIVGAGSSGEGSMDASNFLKPALARGEIQLIGATTLTEYRKYIEKDPALERRFQPVLVPEPTEEQAVKMLKAIKDKYEAYHRVKIPDDAVEQAVHLSKRYVGDRFLPDKSVDLIDEAASAVRLPMISLPEEIRSLEERVSELGQEMKEAEKSGDKVKARILKSKLDDIQAKLNEKKDEYTMKKGQTTSEVTGEIIKDIVSRWTGIPVSKITGSEMDKLANLEKIMHERLIGQEGAVSVVAQAVRRGRAGLKSTQRPIGSFVFLGPTGVGKTELSKTLAEILFGQEEAMIRFDMTEYMEKHEVAKLLGAPPGYVGYEEGGKLTEAVRRRPYSVVLFDEVEKAHPDIFNILLQILDDGRLTDNKGHVVSFKNTVVICTSNIGTSIIQDEMLKSGKGEIEEPPMVSTYAYSPRGREILTIGAKYFERDLTATPKEDPEKDVKKEEKKDETIDTAKDDKKSDNKKTSTNEQKSQWQDGMMLDYFAGQKIEVAQKSEGELTEKTEKEKVDFPSMGFDTHAMSAKGVEMVTKGNTIFVRNSTTAKIWETSTLIDYLKDSVVVNALPDVPEEQLPTVKWKTHAYTPDEMEIVTYKDRYWRRKEGTTDWETGYLKDYFVDQTCEGSFPTTHWDIHTFSPLGKEIIIFGDSILVRAINEKVWKTLTLKDYFGADFPLDRELEEKKKVDEEISRKKYDVVKDKVMGELRKFFRPELINRFDEVIIFEPLKFSHMMQIVKLQLESLAKLLEEQDMGFIYTDSAVKEIVRSGFDPVYGARPLRRAIQKLVENPISTLIIEKKVSAGDQILVDFDGENFVFNIEKVELVDPSKIVDNVIKSYLCESCGNKFTTETKKSATPICSKCASVNIQEVVEEKKEETKESAKEEEKQESISEVQSPKEKFGDEKKDETHEEVNGVQPPSAVQPKTDTDESKKDTGIVNPNPQTNGVAKNEAPTEAPMPPANPQTTPEQPVGGIQATA